MKREELILGAIIYAVIFTAGIYGPILKKLAKLPWGKPVGSLVQAYFQTSDSKSDRESKKALLASRVHQILNPEKLLSAPTTQDLIHQKLEKNWDLMASHPRGIGGGKETSPSYQAVILKKSGFKLTPVILEKKRLSADELPKG